MSIHNPPLATDPAHCGPRVQIAGHRNGVPTIRDPGEVRKPDLARLNSAVAGRDSRLLRQCLASPWYAMGNPDVLAARMDPYEHWLANGINEGRLPCEDVLTLLERLMRERTGGPAAVAAKS